MRITKPRRRLATPSGSASWPLSRLRQLVSTGDLCRNASPLASRERQNPHRPTVPSVLLGAQVATATGVPRVNRRDLREARAPPRLSLLAPSHRERMYGGASGSFVAVRRCSGVVRRQVSPPRGVISGALRPLHEYTTRASVCALCSFPVSNRNRNKFFDCVELSPLWPSTFAQ